jgi:hypothetical protein
MNQKRNKIIVLIGLLIIASSVGYYLFKNLTFKKEKNVFGTICIHVNGQSWDSRIIDDVAISNIELQLFKKNDVSQMIKQGITDANGDYCFSELSLPEIYWIKVNNNKSPANYYLSYENEISLPYKTQRLNHYIKLYLNDAAQRDIKRQNLLYLYQSLLEDYKKEHGSYPIILGDKPTIKVNSLFVSIFSPYLKKKNMDAKNLLDPLSGRYFIYRSDGKGEHYWLLAYPEIVFDVPLFDKKENAYLIHQ